MAEDASVRVGEASLAQVYTNMQSVNVGTVLMETVLFFPQLRFLRLKVLHRPSSLFSWRVPLHVVALTQGAEVYLSLAFPRQLSVAGSKVRPLLVEAVT